MKTTIHSNGSKWNGQEPDSIDFLINERLNKYTIEERFFSFYEETTKEKGKTKVNFCPITEKETHVNFFGNFEEYSHVFRIDTDDPEIIKKLTQAIKNNKGWLKYYNKNLLK
jgi:hypothetical protein